VRVADAQWPAWATEAVEVVPPNPGWQARGEQQCRDLERDLAGWLISPVEHIGSTAVPGLAAKPVLDFQAKVNDLGCVPELASVLGSRGWHWVPVELDQRPWERFFVQVARDRRRAHLHLVDPSEPQWSDRLVFRDALRSNSSLAADYARLKATLAVAHRTDREAYTRAKAAFITEVLARL